MMILLDGIKAAGCFLWAKLENCRSDTIRSYAEMKKLKKEKKQKSDQMLMTLMSIENGHLMWFIGN